MHKKITLSIVMLLVAFGITACTSSEPKPEPKKSPFNQADDQRHRASQSQGELSSDTSK